jgi:hypothetical protein
MRRIFRNQCARAQVLLFAIFYFYFFIFFALMQVAKSSRQAWKVPSAKTENDRIIFFFLNYKIANTEQNFGPDIGST